jgi:glycosyltransferase involved in cell wall biosynthesis
MSVIGLLIVKNEAAVLQRCIDSWSKVCDHFFILDTGSDNCDYLYNLFPTKPFNYFRTSYEKFSFGQARNDCIEYAERVCGFLPETYYVMIDADDVLPAGFEFPELTKDAYAINYRTSPTTSHVHYRMWRAELGLRYVGAVHEYLNVSGRNCAVLPLEVIHDPLPNKGKDPKRNLNILMSERNSLRQLFYLGNELMDNGRYSEACIYWSHYVDRCRFEGFWDQELMCCMWRLARYTADKTKALEICAAGLALFPNCAELEAEVMYRQGALYLRHIPWYEHLFGERRFYV